MSYGILHMEKIKAGGVRGIQSHIRREHTSKTNPNIDYDRTQYNYSLLEDRDNNLSLKKLVNSIIKKFVSTEKKIRKDAVLINSFIITSDHEKMMSMSDSERYNFFYDSAKFFEDRYGEKLVFADVHNDEYTPHLHLGIVPVKDNKLCAKDMFNRTELRQLQTDFYENVGKKYGMERGKEGSKAQHLTETDLKAKTLEDNIKVLQEQKLTLENEIQSRKQNLDMRERQILEREQNLDVRERNLSTEIEKAVETQKNDYITAKQSYEYHKELFTAKIEKIDFIENTKSKDLVIKVERLPDGKLKPLNKAMPLNELVDKENVKIQEEIRKLKEYEEPLVDFDDPSLKTYYDPPFNDDKVKEQDKGMER